MTNTAVYLNPKLFDEDVKLVSIRDGFGEGIVEAAQKDERVMVLCADLRDSLKLNEFAEKYPDRFVEVGVAEQNLVTVASGMAAEGKIPLACSYAVFSPGRNWEQIRTTICYNDRPVKIVGSHGGLSVGPDGATHQALEDIALMRVLPNMTVIEPADFIEAKKATLAVVDYPGPCYLRLSRDKTPAVTTTRSPFIIGQAEIFHDGEDVTIVTHGPIIYQALIAANKLKRENISTRVLNCHTIKPLDKRAILSAAERTGAMVVAGDHQIAGGLGGAVAELLSREFPVPVKVVGVNDCFGQSGEADELWSEYGLISTDIIKAVTYVLRLKGKRGNV